MSDDLATNPGAGGEQASPAPASEVANNTQGEQDAAHSLALPPELAQFVEQSDAGEEEYEDVSWEDGKSYKVPKALRDALLRHRDYTQKTQALAENSRALEAEKAKVATAVQAQQKFLGEFANLQSVRQQLGEFAKVNFEELWNTDPVSAGKLNSQYQRLIQQHNDLAQNIQGKVRQAQHEHAQRIEEQRRNVAKQIDDRNASIRSRVKDWDKVYPTLVEYAGKHGLTKDMLDSTPQSGALEILHKAHLFDTYVAKQLKDLKANKPKAEPVSQVAAGGSPAAGPKESDDIAAWMKKRNRQVSR